MRSGVRPDDRKVSRVSLGEHGTGEFVDAVFALAHTAYGGWNSSWQAKGLAWRQGASPPMTGTAWRSDWRTERLLRELTLCRARVEWKRDPTESNLWTPQRPFENGSQ